MRNVEDVTTVDVVSTVKACTSTQGLGVTLILAGQVYDGSASYHCGSKALPVYSSCLGRLSFSLCFLMLRQ